MTNTDDIKHRSILQGIAHRVMLERGLDPDFPSQALAELDRIHGPATQTEASTRDLRNLLWCSIDNDDSLDLDQLTVAEAMPAGAVKILVAIADVDAVVKKRSALDDHAKQNTTSVYTVAETFPMLPEKLSNDLTSLNYGSDRLAVVIEMVFATDGSLQGSDIYKATVRNHAKLAYNSVAAWLDGTGPMPKEIGAVAGLDENLRLQDRIAQTLKTIRYANGALELETIEAAPDICRGGTQRPGDRTAEPGQRSDRGIHDRCQWRGGTISRVQKVSIAAACRPHAQTLGPDRRDRRRTGAQCYPGSPIQRPWSNSWHRLKPPILFVFPIFRSASSSCWVTANTSSGFPERTQPGTSALRSGTIITLRPRTADIRT